MKTKPVILGIAIVFGLVFCLPQSATAQNLPRIAVKISGGMTYLLLGDLNDHFDALNRQISDLADPGSLQGQYDNLHTGFSLGGELILNMTPQLGIGIGAGYLQAGNKSDDISYTTGGILTSKDFQEWTVTAIPITLGFYYTYPISSSLSLSMNLGGGYYSGKIKTHTVWSFALLTSTDAQIEASKSTVGFHGGLGLEIKVNPNVALVLEARGRYAKFSDIQGVFKGNGTTMGIPWSTETDVNLYYYRYNGQYTVMRWLENPPSGSLFQNVRNAVIDISGIDFGAGIKINF